MVDLELLHLIAFVVGDGHEMALYGVGWSELDRQALEQIIKGYGQELRCIIAVGRSQSYFI